MPEERQCFFWSIWTVQRKGLSDRLRQAGFSAEATEDAMNYVRSYGYLNDYRYAMNYISFRMGNKSRQKILQELSGKELTARLPLQPGKRQAEIEEPDELAILRTTVEKKCQPGTALDERGCAASRDFFFEEVFPMEIFPTCWKT